MATTRDIIQGAYSRLGLLPLGQDLDADRAAAGLTVLNDLLAAWQSEGISTGISLPLCLSQNFPMDPQHWQGVKALLAMRLADDSGFEASASVQRAALKGWQAIMAAYVTSPEACQDDALIWMPSLRRYGFK